MLPCAYLRIGDTCVRTVRQVFFRSLGFDLRGFEKGSDHFEYIRIAQRAVIEPGSIDQDNSAAIEIETSCNLHGIGARF